MLATTKLGTAVELSRKEGLGAVWEQIRDKLLLGEWAPTVQSVGGERLHQKLLMYRRVGYWPRIREPRTFNERLMHRKLYTDDDRFATVEDKWAVREYVAERVGEEVLPKVHHVTDDPETIPFDSLPDEYVVKPTHLSGPVAIVDGDEVPDREAIRRDCRDWLDRTHGAMKGEYWYGEIPPRILIEERLQGAESDVPRDFKFFVFHGRVEYVQVDFDRHENHTRRFYDRNWNAQEFELKFPMGPEMAEPERLDEMIHVAEMLGDEFEFIRVDLYQTDSSGVLFGELTVTPESGGGRFRPVSYDFVLGTLW